MKVSVAQVRPIKGDIQRNMETHLMWIDRAVSKGAGLIVFPELSITGYEPTLASSLATTAEDKRFDLFQQISDACGIIIGIGVPLNQSIGISISMLLFSPKQSRQVYSKIYLHPDEQPYFVSHEGIRTLELGGKRFAFSICYELSVPEHEDFVRQHGADFYVSSVAKSVNGVDTALIRLSEIAQRNSMPVLMANCIGHCDDFDCGGKSSIIDNSGKILEQLDANTEGILIYDYNTNEVVKVVS